MLKNVIVLGSGTAGLIAAIALKRKIPQLNVRIVRSPEIGVIGVGEGTTPNFPRFFFEYLGISHRHFYTYAQPTWKIGIRLLWGPRQHINYGFGQQLDAQWSDLPRPNGYFCQDEFVCADVPSALMASDKVSLRQSVGGGPEFQPFHAFHLENKKLVDALEMVARNLNIEFIDGKVTGAKRGPAGVESVMLDDGRSLAADFFIDSSGFRSELLGKAMEEPYIPFDKTLFCDRTIIGGWERTMEPIHPFTVAETMDAGWCWQIEHENYINRGYVYSSAFISDEEARAEFLRKNPKITDTTRTLKFRSGRYQRSWVDNVLAVGNACGFVEPLEATSLMVICWQCQTFVDFLLHTGVSPTPTMRALYNRVAGETWDEIRDFLGLHYQVNTRLDTPFWKHCREKTDLSGIGPLLEFYRENGPTGLCRTFLQNTGSQFGIEGFLVMLVGNRVPYRGMHHATETERQIWNRHVNQYQAQAAGGVSVKEALGYIRNPGWRWFDESRSAG